MPGKISDRFTNIEKQQILVPDEDSDLKLELMLKIENTPVWNDFSAEKQKELIAIFVNKKMADSPESEREKVIISLQTALVK